MWFKGRDCGWFRGMDFKRCGRYMSFGLELKKCVVVVSKLSFKNFEYEEYRE